MIEKPGLGGITTVTGTQTDTVARQRDDIETVDVPRGGIDVPNQGDNAPVQQRDLRAHPLTTQITGKRDAILDNLPPELQDKLQQRISDGDVTAKDLKSLLHFGYFSQGNTTAESRVAIRSILAAHVAEGGSIESAGVLKAMLKAGSTNAPIHALPELKQAPTLAVTVSLISNSAVKGDNDAFVQRPKPEKLDLLSQVVQGFPDDPGRAGKHEYADSNVTVSRNDQGKMHVSFANVAFTGAPKSDQVLTATQVGQLEALFKETVDVPYTKMNATMQMLTHFRAHQSDEPPMTMEQAYQTFTFDGDSACREYGAGNCLSLAQQLSVKLAEQGIEHVTSGTYSSGLCWQPNAEGTKVFLPGQAQASGANTHCDVIVPYKTEDGEDRVLVLVPGMGVSEKEDGHSKYFENLTPQELEDKMQGGKRLQANGDSVDVGQVQKTSLGYMTNLQMLNTKQEVREKSLFGVDLIGGKIYLNTQATTDVGLRPEGTARGASIDIQDVMANPDEMMTLEYTFDGTGDKIEMTKLEALTAFLEFVAIEFDQPDDFVPNVLTLAANLDDYRNAVLWPETIAFHQKEGNL